MFLQEGEKKNKRGKGEKQLIRNLERKMCRDKGRHSYCAEPRTKVKVYTDIHIPRAHMCIAVNILKPYPGTGL